MLKVGDIYMEYKNRKHWSTSTDWILHGKLKDLSNKTRIPISKLLDEAIEDLLVKHKVISKSEKKTP